MSEIVDFAAAKENKTPHNYGQARCLGCHHEWTAVAPAGMTVLECPRCETDKGVFLGLVLIRDENHWVCQCGNRFFCFTKTQTYCPVCGTTQTSF